MDVAIIVALIALLGTVASLGWQAWVSRQQREADQALAASQHEASAELERLRDELARQRQADEHERDAAGQLDLYREPLLAAAKDLHHRIRNIREQGFLGYLAAGESQHSRMALLGTFYRLGKYWGTVDSLYGSVDLLQFERNAATKDVAGLLDRIGTTFAGDGYDVGGRTLMVWREEQRAVAELMQRDAVRGRAVIGVASFVERYDRDFAVWFKGWDDGLRTSGIESSARLARLQELSAELMDRLQAERV